MTGKHTVLILAGAAIVAVAAGLVAYAFRPFMADLPDKYAVVKRLPEIFPDYSSCVVPPNIAPLNFVIRRDAREYRVKIHAVEGKPIIIVSASPKIVIPQRPWTTLLDRNRGGRVHFEIYARGADGWDRFAPITNRIAVEDLDPYLVYRLLGPLHNAFRRMGTYQRDLRAYDESPILTSERGERCVNCHTFLNNRTDRMLMHMRGPQGLAMLLALDGRTSKINTRTKFKPAPAGYSSWHPSGKVVVFSVNKLILMHHRSTVETRDVFDYASDLGLYVVESNGVAGSPKIADPDCLETFPTWSPDGRYLYFCRARRAWPRDAKERRIVPPVYRKVRYDLMRIRYHIDTGSWGRPETVLAGDAMRPPKSITQPRISPDGKFLLFCAAEYGNFPVYRSDSDLYMMDLTAEPKRHWRLAVNSDASESWHGWSRNGRWIVFSSKRCDGVFARPHFSYIDAAGKSYKPVLLPQKDPTFYESLLKTYNVPELVTGPVTIDEAKWLRAIRSSKEGRGVSTVFGTTPNATMGPASKPSRPGSEPDYQ